MVRAASVASTAAIDVAVVGAIVVVVAAVVVVAGYAGLRPPVRRGGPGGGGAPDRPAAGRGAPHERPGPRCPRRHAPLPGAK